MTPERLREIAEGPAVIPNAPNVAPGDVRFITQTELRAAADAWEADRARAESLREELERQAGLLAKIAEARR